MSIDPASLEVRDNPDQKRFEVRVGEHLAIAEYLHSGDRIIFSHTAVPPALQGQGIGDALIRGALEQVKARSLGVVAMCPFVAAYVAKHPEYAPLLRPW
ncbi:MAG TPA: GNAT family N-acetyltransferase [Herpetosiphonaceae bacterium]|nr:GNAT family N-acetyltransferase [Herpetosiphonaceae bacterium]